VPTNEVYGVVAYSGSDQLLTTFQFCGLVKCANATLCTDFELEASAIFSSISVEAELGEGLHMLALVASNEGQLIDPIKYNVNEEGTIITSNSKFDDIILSATIVGIGWE
jgi:hypothetical protein